MTPPTTSKEIQDISSLSINIDGVVLTKGALNTGLYKQHGSECIEKSKEGELKWKTNRTT